MSIPVLVATMTGTAELAAEEAVAALSANGRMAHVLPMDGLLADAIREWPEFIVVSSTYGHGDIPDNGQALFEALEREAPNLRGKRFAVFALGDRTYADTFCHAGEAWDALLTRLGAERLAPLCRHDASSGTLPEDVAGDWAAGLLAARAA